MASAAAIRRRGSANNARIAAKQRRQKILVVVLAAVLVGLLAYEVPHLLKRSSGNSSAAVAAAPAASIPEPERKRLPAVGTAPIRSQSSRCRTVTPAPWPPAGLIPSRGCRHLRRRPLRLAALPKRIVIGRPGGHRVAKRGWIVILASIPTSNGRPTACASRAERAVRRRALGPQLVEPPAAARRLLGRLLGALPDAGGGLATRGRHPRGRLPVGLHPRADRVPVRRLKTCLRAEEGMTLIELLIAMVVMSIGIAALVAGFSSGVVSINRARGRRRQARLRTSRWSSIARRRSPRCRARLRRRRTPRAGRSHLLV